MHCAWTPCIGWADEPRESRAAWGGNDGHGMNSGLVQCFSSQPGTSAGASTAAYNTHTSATPHLLLLDPPPSPPPSNQPNRELRLQPNAPFPLAAGLTEVSLALRPLQPGRRQYVVHAVDLARRALLASWLVCAVNRLPAVTKSFSLTIPAALGARKKVSLANPYSYDTTYKFYSDQVCGRVSCVHTYRGACGLP